MLDLACFWVMSVKHGKLHISLTRAYRLVFLQTLAAWPTLNAGLEAH